MGYLTWVSYNDHVLVEKYSFSFVSDDSSLLSDRLVTAVGVFLWAIDSPKKFFRI